MKTILFATGDHQNRWPLTRPEMGTLLPVPGALLPVANRPVMEHLLEMLGRQGIKRILVSLHSDAGQIETCFGSGARWGLALEYVLQRDDLGSAGSLAWAHSQLDETFLALPADRLIELDIIEALAAHRSAQHTVTRILSQGGEETGAYLFEPSVLDLIPRRTPFDIAGQLLPTLQQTGAIIGEYAIQGYWNPLDSLQAFHGAQTWIMAHHAASPAELSGPTYFRIGGYQISPGIWLGRDVSLHPSVQLEAPVHIGDHTQVNAGVELGPNAVIGANTIIDQGATIRNSTVLDATYVGQCVNIDQRVVKGELLIDFVSGESVRIQDPFLLATNQPAANLPAPTHSLLWRLPGAALAMLLLLLCLPLCLVMGLLAWLTSGRPFERATRVRMKPTGPSERSNGYNLLRFACHRKNGRLTPAGAWLEKTELNRLPELWNVIRGDLAMVGTHPLTVEETLHASEPWQEPASELAPGFTGLWYVQTSKLERFDRETNEQIQMQMEMQFADAYYAATHTLSGDLKLLLQTPFAWYRRIRRPQNGTPRHEDWISGEPLPQ